MSKEKMICFYVEEELFRALIVRLAKREITLKSYVVELIRKDLHLDQPFGVQISNLSDEQSAQLRNATCQVKNAMTQVVDILCGKQEQQSKNCGCFDGD